MQNLLLIPIALSMQTGQKPEYNIKGRFTDFKNDTLIVLSCKVDDILRASINPNLYIHKDKEQKWQKAVADNALPWINVINPRNLPTDLYLSIKYDIEGFPTKIILGPDGRIISVVVGESPEFDTKLDSLLE